MATKGEEEEEVLEKAGQAVCKSGVLVFAGFLKTSRKKM